MESSARDLLSALLAGPYSHFRKVGDDDWRDPSEKNAGFSLSSKGFRDHRSGESGSLYELAKRHHLDILNSHQSDDKGNRAQFVWDKSTRTDDPKTEAHRLVTAYLNQHRKIPLGNFADLLSLRLLRFNHYKEDLMLVYPSLTPQNYRDAVAGKVFSVNRLQRVFLNTDGSKHSKGKKHLGSEKAESCGFVIPPLSGNLGSEEVQVFEGLEDALSIRDRFPDHWLLVATDKGGLRKLTEFFGEGGFTSARIISDHDTDDKPQNTGQAAAWRLGATLRAQGVEASVRMPPDPKNDANSALQAGRLDEWMGSLIEVPEQFRCQEADPELAERQKEGLQKPPLVVLSLEELLVREVPPRRNLLDPWLPEQGLCMVYAPRGIGKTWFGLYVAYAVASGGSFLKWQADSAEGVLYVDGEMPLAVMKERTAQMVASTEKEATASFKIVTPDAQMDRGVPDLAQSSGQAEIDKLITDDIKLIVLDNLSCLTRSGKENEGESWLPVQEWALRLRSRGKSVLFVHHAGKSGQQRGTSRREDVLDTVIALKRPPDYTPEAGACFEVHFEKSRGLYGEDTKPIEALLEPHTENNGVTLLQWSWKALEDSTREKVVRLKNEGLSQVEIAEELGVHKSTVNRHLKKADLSKVA